MTPDERAALPTPAETRELDEAATAFAAANAAYEAALAARSAALAAARRVDGTETYRGVPG